VFVIRLWYSSFNKKDGLQIQGGLEMDHNLALSCIGYGSVRVLRERKFSTAPFALPANWILKKPDPVQFCIDALGTDCPELAARVDKETRRAIYTRLEQEASRGLAH
jgi:hypothetical protein